MHPPEATDKRALLPRREGCSLSPRASLRVAAEDPAGGSRAELTLGAPCAQACSRLHRRVSTTQTRRGLGLSVLLQFSKRLAQNRDDSRRGSLLPLQARPAAWVRKGHRAAPHDAAPASARPALRSTCTRVCVGGTPSANAWHGKASPGSCRQPARLSPDGTTGSCPFEPAAHGWPAPASASCRQRTHHPPPTCGSALRASCGPHGCHAALGTAAALRKIVHV